MLSLVLVETSEHGYNSTNLLNVLLLPLLPFLEIFFFMFFFSIIDSKLNSCSSFDALFCCEIYGQ